MIPIAQPSIGDTEIAAVADVMRSGMLAQGAVVEAFEEQFAASCGTNYGIGVNSGTAALHAVLLALGIGPGDEVIVPSFTFIATATSVSMCRATPVMVDIEEDTFTISPEAILAACSPRTKAVIGVHLFGHPFAVGPVTEICEDHNLFLIEDCAQAHGATYGPGTVGSFGTAGCFSFYPTKNMTTGEGGMVTTDDADLAARVRRIINHGQSEKYLHTELGFNLRMTNIGAAIGLAQLKKLEEMNRQRQRNAACYDANLQSEGISTPSCRDNATHVYHQYAVRVEDTFPVSRDALMEHLRKHGIGSAVHYPIPVHRQPLYAETADNPPCPVAEDLAGRVLSLPVHPGVTEDECRFVCDMIRDVR